MSTWPTVSGPRRMRARWVPILALAGLLFAGCLDGGGSSGTGNGWNYGDAFPDPTSRPDGGASEREARDPDATPFDGGPEAWAGTWTFESGSSGLFCPDSGALSIVVSSGTLTITPSVTGEALTVEEDGCAFHFTVVDDTATEDPDQVCTAWAVQIPMWSLALTSDGTMDETLGGTALVDGQACIVSGKSKLVRN
jgi:hypothetical protein